MDEIISRCGDCVFIDTECKDFADENETFPEVGGCKNFKQKDEKFDEEYYEDCNAL